MGFLRNGLNRRFPRLGLLSDLALVGAAVNRMRRRGDTTGSARAGSSAELVLGAGAALRLLQRLRRRRKRVKAAKELT